MDLGVIVVEERVRAQNWLGFDEVGVCLFVCLFFFFFLWLFDRESSWIFTVLLGKRKGLNWGCKDEGKERKL